MKKLIIPLALGILLASFTISPVPLSENEVAIAAAPHRYTDSSLFEIIAKADFIYENARLEEKGLSKQAFEYACKGYMRLLEKKLITRPRYLTICDLGQSSKKKRLYIIDMLSNELTTNTYVAHGRNSGAEFATQFSNKPESLQSSLGFYITGQTYMGKHGLSLRLAGVDGRYNNKAFERRIVMHGATYVDEGRLRRGGYIGRSWGCPALPQKESAKIINTVKEGSCLFIYHPQKYKLNGSTILND